MVAWVVELHGVDTTGPTDETRYFALGRGVAFTDAPFAPAGLISWQRASQNIAVSAAGVVGNASGTGEVVIANVPKDITLAGPLDALEAWAWQGRAAAIYRVPAKVWADRVLCDTGLLEQPVSSGGELRFTLRDPRAALDTPFQTLKYGGTNVAPNGVDGAGDLKGKPRPVCLGVNSNVSGVLVNFPKQIYELHCGLAEVICYRDGAYPLALGTVRANVASMLSNAPAPGTYDTCSVSTGTYVRLGSLPSFKPCFDVQEGSTSADRTHAQVWKRIRTTYCGTAPGDIGGASVTAVDALDSHEVGWWIDSETTCRAVLDKVLGSLSGFEVRSLAGIWSIGQLNAPVGSPALNLVLVQPGTALKPTDRPLTSLERATPSFAPDGAPPYQVQVRWGFNNTVMAPADLAGAANARLKDKFSSDWRVETASSATTWDPVALTGNFPNAPAFLIDTGYQPGIDGVTCPHAVTYAAARLALYGALPGQFQVSFVPQPGDTVLPGTVVGLTYPAHGLSSGASFVVLQSSWTVQGRVPEVVLVVGLQT